MINTKQNKLLTYFTEDELNVFYKYRLNDENIFTLLKSFDFDALASVVWFQKYADKDAIEYLPEHMHMRLAHAFSSVEDQKIKLEKILLEKKKDIEEKLSSHYLKREPMLEDDIFASMYNFEHIIPQGSIMAVLGTDTLGSISNCVVIDSPHDSYAGIFKSDQELAQLMKARCGVGIDITTLRPEGSVVSNFAKTSSGAISFMERFSNTTREVSQGSRRGALMISIDINHPDIEQFINIKQDLSKVTGANISIKVNDDFMRAVEQDNNYCLRWPAEAKVLSEKGEEELNELYNASDKDGKYKILYRWVRAKEIWEKLIKAAHTSAEPGILFWGAVINNDPAGVYASYRALSTNPCFTGDMKLLTVEGYRTFKSLDNTETELINKDGKIISGTIFKSGIKYIYEIISWDNKSIKCTEDHIFMTVSGEEIMAKNLKGHRLMPYFILEQEVNEYTTYGFLQGDGSLTRLVSASEAHIGKDDKDIAELFEIEDKKNKRDYYINGYNEILKVLKFSSKALPNRTLPKAFNGWNNKNKRMFLKGLFSANGSIIKNDRIAFKGTCKEIIEELSDVLLNSFKINSYITTNKAKDVEFSNGTYLCKESYDLNISKFENIKRFGELIGFIHKYKQKALNTLILAKAPLIRKVINTKRSEEVYDFSLQSDIHWGVVEGVVVHNCGELPLPANDSCRLIALNLLAFVENSFTKNASYNFDKFYTIVYDAMRMSDNVVDLELERIEAIIAKIDDDDTPEDLKAVERNIWVKLYNSGKNGRRTGLGFTALGDTAAALGLKYGSDEFLDFIKKMMKTKLSAELECTIDLAVLNEPFKGWDPHAEFTKIDGKLFGMNSFFQMLSDEFPEQVERMIKYGRRNVSWSTVAPTGSLSMLAQVTSGIEPLFKPFYTRRKKITVDAEDYDYIDDNGDKWTEHSVLHKQFQEWIETIFLKQGDFIAVTDVTKWSKELLQEAFSVSPWFGSTADDVSAEDRIKTQAVIQKYTTHSISSTVNLPKDVSIKKVNDIYMKGWKARLKGITVYRDGSRDGVLITKPTAVEDIFKYSNSKKRPVKINGIAHTTQLGKDKFSVFVGFIEGLSYEIFAYKGGTKEGKGEIVKEGKGNYQFIGDTEGSNNRIITGKMTSEQEIITRLISGSLRHGRDIKFIVEDLEKTSGSLFSFNNALARILKKYIPDGTSTNAKCPECGDDNMVYEEGCRNCLSCGHSMCG